MLRKSTLILLCIALWVGMSMPVFALESAAASTEPAEAPLPTGGSTPSALPIAEAPLVDAGSSAAYAGVSGSQAAATPEDVTVAGDLDEYAQAMEESEPEEKKGLESFQCKELILFLEEGALMDSHGAMNAVYYEPLEEYVLQYETPEETRAAYKSLVAEYGQEHVLVNLPVESSGWEQTRTNYTPAASASWGNDVMGLDALRDKANNGGPAGKVIVGVVDSGVRPSHTLLKGRISAASTSVSGGQSSSQTYTFMDDNGHGTHVAGIIADGTSDQVQILAVKATDSSGRGSFNNILMGVRYAAQKGAKVINLSFGGDRSANSGLSKDQYQAILDSYEKKVNRICSRYDCMVVAAAGNSKADIDSSMTFPACFQNVIAVGALSTKLQRASFSNYGKSLDFGAPGEMIVSASAAGDYEASSMSGTSMAAPHVSAAAAMVRLYYPSMNHTEAEDLLRANAVDIAPKGTDKYTGLGMIHMGSDVPGTISLKGAPFGAEAVTWTGKALYPKVNVRGRTFIKGKECTMTCTNNVKVGYGKFTLKGKGRYSGTLSGKFLIVPKGTAPTKAKISKKKLTIMWKKQRKQTSGYQVQLSTSQRFSKGVRSATIKNTKKNRYTFKKLKSNTHYYVRVRTYKVVGKQRIYSGWSWIGSVRTK